MNFGAKNGSQNKQQINKNKVQKLSPQKKPLKSTTRAGPAHGGGVAGPPSLGFLRIILYVYP